MISLLSSSHTISGVRRTEVEIRMFCFGGRIWRDYSCCWFKESCVGMVSDNVPCSFGKDSVSLTYLLSITYLMAFLLRDICQEQ